MFTRLLARISLAFILAGSVPAWSSDPDTASSYAELLAKSYAELFAPVQGAGAGKALHLLTPQAFLNKVKAKEPLVALDVRTPAETGVYSVTLPEALKIPISELFKPDNLDRIPTDRTVVVFCLSGTRATTAGTALRHIGFENVYIFKGGYKALVAYMSPKEANTTLQTDTPSE